MDRKMLSLVTFATFSTFTTRPSAGETITRGSDGISRCGFLKKNATKAASKSPKNPTQYNCRPIARIVAASRGSKNLYASLTIMNKDWWEETFVPLCLAVKHGDTRAQRHHLDLCVL